MEGTRKPRMLGWSIAYILILISIFTVPVINMITAAFVMVPVLVMYTRLSTRAFLVHYIASLAVVYLATSLMYSAGWVGVLLIAVSLFLLPPVIQMGNLYKKRAAARVVLTMGTVTLLAELLLSLVISYALNLNPIGRMRALMASSVETLPANVREMMGVDMDTLVQFVVQVLPLYMIGFALFFTVVTHRVARYFLIRSGEMIPGFRAVKDWMLPRSFIWLYLIALILQMFVQDTSSGLYTLLLNLLPLLMAALSAQAISFMFYVAHIKRWNRALPIVSIILLVLFPLPLFFLFSLLGVFDVAFPIRERLKGK